MPYGQDPTTPPMTMAAAAQPQAQPVAAQPFQQPAQQSNPLANLDPALAPLVTRESGGKPFVGYTPPGQPLVDLSSATLDDTGFPIWSGRTDPKTGLRSHAAGILQIQPGTWRPVAKDLGIKDFSEESQIKVANEIKRRSGLTPWRTQTSGYGKDPVVASGGWSVDPSAIESAQGQKDTKFVWMMPDDYKQMVQKGEEAEDRPESKSLNKSVGKGDQISSLPEITVQMKGDQYVVIDQDGWRRADLAEKSGVNLIPVAVRGAAGDAKEIVGMGGKVLPFDFRPVPTVPKPPGLMKEFGRGLADVPIGAAQLATHAGAAQAEAEGAIGAAGTDQNLPPQMTQAPAQMDASIQQREQQIEAERASGGQTGTDWARLAGNIVGTIPLGAVAPAAGGGALATMAGGALAGAAGSALAPVTQPGNYGEQKAAQIGMGGALGAGLGLGGNMLAHAAQPYIEPAVQRLLDAKVRLTPGMIRGGVAKGIENRLSSAIITAPGAVKRAIEDFNKAAYDRVLSRIGKAYEGNKVGYERVDAVEKELSKEYGRILSPLRFKVDQQFASDVENLRDMASETPADEARQFEAILKNRVIKRMGPEGAMDGQTFKTVESELSEISRRLSRSEVQGQRDLGHAVDTLNGSLRENLERQNPEAAANLRKVNGAWAAFVIVRKAAANRAKSEGIFTPSDLLTAVKRTAGERVFARGAGLLQDLAQDGEKVIPNTYPDSGTAGRWLMGELALGGGAAGMLHRPEALAALAAGTAAYTAPGVALLSKAAGAGFPGVRNILARAALTSTRSLAPASAMSFTAPTPPPGP
jgi:hypothetical protein